MRRTKLTRDQWKVVGKQAKQLNDRVVHLSVLADRIGRKYSDRYVSILRLLVKLKSDLEDEMSRQLVDFNKEDLNIFYGKNDREELEEI